MKNPLLVVVGTLALSEVFEHWTDLIDAFTESSMLVGMKVLLLLAPTTIGIYAIGKGLRR